MTNTRQTLKIAFRALARNKLRSALTMLGIIIGVAAVIAMVAIGEGARPQDRAASSSVGTNLLMIVPGSDDLGRARGPAGRELRR